MLKEAFGRIRIMIVQIYEVTSVEGAEEIAKVGVDHIGVVILTGKRIFDVEVIPTKARKIFASLPKGKKGVALSLSHDLNAITKMIKKAKPNILHLCALSKDISPRDITFLKKRFPWLKIMRTIPVIDGGSIVLAKEYEGIADYLLLDSYKKGDWQVGVTGKVHNWKISKKIVDSVRIPAILAGGLGPDNVEEAIKAVKPYGVDSKTKTDKPEGAGKDLDKVEKFVKKAKLAD